MPQDLDAFVGWLKSRLRRLDISDPELMDLFWRVHPRLRFLKSAPWGVNLIDIGAGNGGLAHWRHWGKPDRPDLTLYGVDLSVGEHAGLYAGWEAINLDRQMPEFPGVKLDGFFASHLLEYLGAPEGLIEWIGKRAEPGARVYLEWTNPISLDLPTREQLQKHEIEVVTSNFIDDWAHKQAPDLARLSGWLKAAGFELISSGAIDLGILGEELFARGADRDSRTMGYWSMTRSSLYAIAVKAGDAVIAAQETAAITRTSRASADPAQPPAAAKTASEDLTLLRAKRALLVSGLFDAEFYRATYRDMQASTADPLTHYITNGEAEGRSPNSVFFPRYYRRRWMARAPATQNALAHYAEEGERLGYKPHPAFDPQAYLAANPPLAEFVDRPLFHYLHIGRAAGLPVARGEALGRILEAQPHAGDFEYSQRRNHYELTRYKQALVRELGVEEGFAFYKEMFALPDSGRIERKAVTSLYEFAEEHGAAFHMLDPGDEPFAMPPPRVIGEGNQRALEGLSRAIFVTCLIDARVRARSGFIEVGDKALLDYQGDELARIDDELDFDPAVFHVEDGAAWMIGPEDEASPIEIDEAFMLIGPHSDGFGHWMLDLLPRYVAAGMSGALPPVPVLIDQSMPATQRESLRLMLPEGGEMIDLPPHATARVRRLWCAPSQIHLPLSPKRDERLKRDYQTPPPARFATLIREMLRRVEPIAMSPTGRDRVYLPHRSDSPHLLANSADIETAAVARDFQVDYPEELSFAEQVALVRHARFIVAPKGPQVLLALFARPGTKLCCLCPTGRVSLSSFTLLRELGIDVTVLEGPSVHDGEDGSGQISYRVEARALCNLLDAWLGDQPRIGHLIAGAATSNIFSYWDKPDLTAIKPFLDEWRSHFPNFAMLGDRNVEPFIQELFPQHLEMYRRIRIPTAKSDLALLLGLYKLGGLYVDCHCGIRDAGAIQELLGRTHFWELILYDHDHATEVRPATKIHPLNSVLFTRPNCQIILQALDRAFRKLAAHWKVEREHGYQPYDIWSLTGPGNLADTLLVDADAPISEVKPQYLARIRFLQEGTGEPISRYVHKSYRIPEMHWSVRQQHELLFEPDIVATANELQTHLPGAQPSQRARIRLFTAIAHDAQLLGHFLGHYRRAGVTDFFIAADDKFSDEVGEFSSTYDITFYRNLDVSDTILGQVSAVTEMRRKHQGAAEWAIIVDLDEFVEFDADLSSIISAAEREGANVVRGVMWDRFARNGRTAGFDDASDLKSVYPVKALFIRNVMQGNDSKGILVKGVLKSSSAHHKFEDEILYSKELEISHYKWTTGAVERLRTAHQLISAVGEGFAVEYARILEHYQRHGRFAWEEFGGIDTGT